MGGNFVHFFLPQYGHLASSEKKYFLHFEHWIYMYCKYVQVLCHFSFSSSLISVMPLMLFL